MALTVSGETRIDPARYEGPRVIGQILVTFDSSYATGGEAIAASDINSDFSVIHSLKAVGHNTAGVDYLAQYDYQAGKIKMFHMADGTDPGTEEGNATDLSGVSILFEYVCS